MHIAWAVSMVSVEAFVLVLCLQLLEGNSEESLPRMFRSSFEVPLIGIASMGSATGAFFFVFTEQVDAVSDMLAFVAALVVFVSVRGTIELWRYFVSRYLDRYFLTLNEELDESKRRSLRHAKQLSAESISLSACSHVDDR